MKESDCDLKFEKALKFLVLNMPLADKLVKPTILHSVRVGMYLKSEGYGCDIAIAGLLHDIIEDSHVCKDDLEKSFGKHVTKLVLSNTKNEYLPDTEKYTDLVDRCIYEGEDALIIKAADIIDNYNYFKQLGGSKSIKKLLYLSKLVKDRIPKTFRDPIFSKLI